jgi:hypothetical protein
MTAIPSAVWFEVFPGLRIHDVLSYVAETWNWLQCTFETTVSFDCSETELTDNLCEALEDRGRRRMNGIDCDFQAETWELRRDANGNTTRIARADIRVILGAPGTPHLIIEFKKLDGSSNCRWRYCFDGMNRFVEGKYAVDHAYGVMCGFSLGDLATESVELANYIAVEDHLRRLCCIADRDGRMITLPSRADPVRANFDTSHERQGIGTGASIVLLHTLLQCPSLRPSQSKPRSKSKAKARQKQRQKQKPRRRHSH